VVPLKQMPLDPATAPPIIVNIVSTANLLPQTPDKRYKLPLDAISMRLGCSQYAPVLFAANIIKLTDATTNATVLVFGSGKIVVVSGLSFNHTRYISQLIRVIIEQISCMMIAEDGTTIIKGSLVGRTIFQHCHIHNIVGHGDLGCRIDLQAMCDAAPACCKWYPDLFPGLKCKIWLNSEHRCACKAKMAQTIIKTKENAAGEEDAELQVIFGKQNKCVCAVKVLIFDSGCIVITGGRHVRDVNSVFFRIKQLAPQFKSGTGDSVIPKEDRFYQRLSAMMVPTGETLKQAKMLQRPEMKPSDAIASVLANTLASSSAASSVPGGVKRARLAGGTPLMRMAESGRVNDVRMTLEMDKSQANEMDEDGRTPLDRLKLIPPQERTLQHKQIMELLNVYRI
jgi:TATA-box binding protein (TBP) (component of TFIID and TFIIIB)